jgi:hypothetical protein
MFISNDEKKQMQISIRALETQVAHLLDKIEDLRASKPIKEKKEKKEKKQKTKTFIVRTAEAPWGFKLDGTPKSRPGRMPQKIEEEKNEKSVSV